MRPRTDRDSQQTGGHPEDVAQSAEHLEKAADESWASYVERQLRNAISKGKFAAVGGPNRPLPELGDLAEEDWWLKRRLRQEGLNLLPPTLAIRGDRARTLAMIEDCRCEQQVRSALEQLNDRIAEANFAPSGPPSTTMPVDVEAALAVWRQRRAERGSPPPPT